MADNKQPPAEAPEPAAAGSEAPEAAAATGTAGSYAASVGTMACLAAGSTPLGGSTIGTLGTVGACAGTLGTAGSLGGAASTQLGVMPATMGICVPPPCFAAAHAPAAGGGLQGAPPAPVQALAPASTVGSFMAVPLCVNFCCSSCGTAPGCGCNAAIAPSGLGAQAPTSTPLAAATVGTIVATLCACLR